MKWKTIKTVKGKKRRHIDNKDNYALCGIDLLELDKCDKSSTAPKCKNCLRILKQLIKEK